MGLGEGDEKGGGGEGWSGMGREKVGRRDG